jgi:hypothetical protein
MKRIAVALAVARSGPQSDFGEAAARRGFVFCDALVARLVAFLAVQFRF